MKKSSLFIFLIIVVVAVSAVAWWKTRDAVEAVGYNRQLFPVTGIDVSAHNGDIDFEQVALDSVDFVYVKCTEGSDFIDRKFQYNIAAARSAGLKVGAYHFFRFNASGSEQARHMLTTLADTPTDLPWAIDVEKWGNDERYDRSDVIRQLRGMVDVLRRAGKKVIIYTNKNGYGHFIDNNFADVPLWLCSKHSRRPGQDCTFWQFSHKGRVRGVAGDVDLDVFCGDTALWHKNLALWCNNEATFTLKY